MRGQVWASGQLGQNHGLLREEVWEGEWTAAESGEGWTQEGSSWARRGAASSLELQVVLILGYGVALGAGHCHCLPSLPLWVPASTVPWGLTLGLGSWSNSEATRALRVCPTCLCWSKRSPEGPCCEGMDGAPGPAHLEGRRHTPGIER